MCFKNIISYIVNSFCCHERAKNKNYYNNSNFYCGTFRYDDLTQDTKCNFESRPTNKEQHISFRNPPDINSKNGLLIYYGPTILSILQESNNSSNAEDSNNNQDCNCNELIGCRYSNHLNIE